MSDIHNKAQIISNLYLHFLTTLYTNLVMKKKLYPVTLFLIDKNSKVGLYCTLLSLSLSIYFGVKRDKKSLFYI